MEGTGAAPEAGVKLVGSPEGRSGVGQVGECQRGGLGTLDLTAWALTNSGYVLSWGNRSEVGCYFVFEPRSCWPVSDVGIEAASYILTTESCHLSQVLS